MNKREGERERERKRERGREIERGGDAPMVFAVCFQV